MYEERILKEITKLKEKLAVEKDSPLAIQIPEGLKQYATEMLEELKDYKPVLFVDPCFGACDIKDQEAIDFGCKSLVHFGHNYMNKPLINTYFVPVGYLFSKEEKEFIFSEIKKLNLKKINLVTTTNFLDDILDIKKELISSGIEVLDSKETMHVRKHMVLGCDSSTIIDKENPIIYIGDGVFHPNNLGFVFEERDIYVINPILRETKKLEINDRFVRQRYGLVAKALTAKTFGILVSSKHGQFRLRFARHIQEKLEKLGKKVYLFASDYVKEEYILGMKIDCYVNTACPRIAYDDFANFKKPIITPQEVSLLEDMTKEFKVDQIRELENYYSRE
jgi:2-(3-amino-3-carboxypropyl)histidine synthase